MRNEGVVLFAMSRHFAFLILRYAVTRLAADTELLPWRSHLSTLAK